MSPSKGKGDALEGGSYCGLELTKHVFKVVEQIIEDSIHIYSKLMPIRGTNRRFNNFHYGSFTDT